MYDVIKRSETTLTKQHQIIIESLHKKHLEEVRQMLNEFDHAQQYLKSQIAHQSQLYVFPSSLESKSVDSKKQRTTIRIESHENKM